MRVGGADIQVRPLRPNLKVRPSGWEFGNPVLKS
jgi:hypothetical protein